MGYYEKLEKNAQVLGITMVYPDDQPKKVILNTTGKIFEYDILCKNIKSALHLTEQIFLSRAIRNQKKCLSMDEKGETFDREENQRMLEMYQARSEENMKLVNLSHFEKYNIKTIADDLQALTEV